MDQLTINRRNRHARFWKRLHPALIGASLVFIAAGIVSYFQPLHASWPLPGGQLQGVCASNGRLLLARSSKHTQFNSNDASRIENWFQSMPEQAREYDWGTSETTILARPGQVTDSGGPHAKATIDIFVAPIWAVMLALGVVAAQCYSCLSDYRLRRGPADCGRCGFNLTGVTSGVCPECGHGAENNKFS